MFEKEADEYRKNRKEQLINDDEFELLDNFDLNVGIAFKDGAEFGYNKANEWHYVKDGKPKDNEYVLIYTDLKNTYVARIPTEKDYFITRRGGVVQMSAVIAWKEIVLPKESE